MAEIEVILPKMGESVAEATITTWLKSEGETIEAEESIVEIATDKVDSEVPAPADGTVTKLLISEGEVAQVGDVIAIISTNGDGGAVQEAAPKAESTPAPAPAAAVSTAPAPTANVTATVDFSNADRFYSPLVKTIAKEEGITLDELNAIAGTGQNGRVNQQRLMVTM